MNSGGKEVGCVVTGRRPGPRREGRDPETASGARQEVVASPYDVRTRVWELHLRGLTRTRIGEQVGLNRQTVARYIAACLREMGAEQREQRERMLATAVARMRHVQQQAWADHDDDEDSTAQRAQYLRVILDAEREIARLCGLYDVSAASEGAVVFRIERVESGGASAVSVRIRGTPELE
jgi:hypothetical protein